MNVLFSLANPIRTETQIVWLNSNCSDDSFFDLLRSSTAGDKSVDKKVFTQED